MKTKTLLLTAAFALAAAHAGAQNTWTINFDTDTNWTAGSGTLTSYQTNHQYNESNWQFTGGDALRNTTTAQDGFPGALGTYSWRLRDGTSVTWTARYTAPLAADEYFTGFGFQARRWDGSPSPAYSVSYSFDGGTTWTPATSVGTSGVLDNAAFGNASNWATFSQPVTSPVALAANQFVVRFSATTGERIMVDNFTATTAIPEPGTLALLGLAGVYMLYARRRR